MDADTLILCAAFPVYGLVVIALAKVTQILFMSQAQTATVETATPGK